MTDSEALDERGISLGPKSTEDVLCDHSSDSWIHNLSFVMILGGWVGGEVHTCRVLLSWVYAVLVVFLAIRLAFPPPFSAEECIPDCKQAQVITCRNYLSSHH